MCAVDEDRARRAAEERFAKAFRLSPLAISVSEIASANILEVNDAFLRTFELDRATVIGRSALELGLWGDAETRARMVAELRARGSVHGFLSLARSYRGRALRLLLSAEPVTLDGRECMITFSQDVTELHDTERRKSELELQLREAQKLEALGTLAGGIAHDFNNILGAITAYTELAQMDVEKPAVVLSHLAEVLRASGRARDLVRQILTFSRKQKPERRPIRIELAVRDALQLLRSTVSATIEIESRLDRDLPVVLADPSQIHQVVMNLATNAAHAMRERPGILSVRLEAVTISTELARELGELRPGRGVRLTVADTGTGMDAQTLERVFEPFFTTKAPGEGTGLGLAVVHGIVRDHEGAISVRSQLGQGTVFELHLPEHRERAALESMAPTELPHGRGERVLVVDDEPALRNALAEMLEHLGYRASVAPGPLEALDLFRAAPDAFDVVLCDLLMPVMTGVDLARELFALRPRTRFAIMSGFSAGWNATGLRAAGVAELLAKPIGAHALASALRRLLDGENPTLQ